jgi:hypothetical protein
MAGERMTASHLTEIPRLALGNGRNGQEELCHREGRVAEKGREQPAGYAVFFDFCKDCSLTFATASPAVAGQAQL